MHPPPAALLLALSAFLPPAAATFAANSAASQARDAEEQYRFLVGLSEKGLHELVVQQARELLRDHPRHPKADLARFRLAEALQALGRGEEALPELRALAGRRGFELAPQVAFRLGQCELEAGRPDAAAEAFERAARSGAADVSLPATFFLGEARFRQERFAEAEASYRAVVQRGPDSEYAREAAAALAWCAHRTGNHDQVVARAETFARAWPDDPRAGELRFLTGEAQLAAGRPEQALEAYRRVDGGALAEPAARGAAFALAALGRHAEAARAFEQLLERFPQGEHAAEAALQCGVAWLRADEPLRAVKALEDARVATTPEADLWRSHALLRASQPEDALARAERGLAARPDADLRARLAVARGDALSALGRAADALQAYESAGSATALHAAAVAALQAGEPEQALRLADALLRDPGARARSGELELVRGEALLALRRIPQAERAFERALAAGEGASAPRALERLGWCAFLREDFAAAEQRFARLCAAHPRADEAEEGRRMLARSRAARGDAAGAREAWNAYLQAHPRGAHRAEALLALARGADEREALAQLERLLRQELPAELEAEALLELGDRLERAGRGDDARARYARLLERHPASRFAPAARYGLGWSLHQAGDHGRAAAVLEQAAEDPSAGAELRGAALELRVFALARAGVAPRELAQAWRALAQDPRADDALRLRALRPVLESLRGRDDGDGAATAEQLLGELLDGVRDRGVAAEACVESAWLALDAGRADAAEAAVRTGMRLLPQEASSGSAAEDPRRAALAEAAFFAGEARFEAGDAEGAARLYALARPAARGELRARVLYKLGFAELRREALEPARAAFAELVERHADSELFGEGLFLLGETSFRLGRDEEAAAVLARVQRELPRHEVLPRALVRLGVAQARLGRWREADAALADLARRKGELQGFDAWAEAELWRGRARAQLGDARGARAALLRTLELDAGRLAAQARLELGRLARAENDHEAALAEFLKVALLYERGDEVAEALLESGRSLEDLGQPQRARAQYAELLEHHRDAPQARAARERLRALGD